MQNKAYPKVNSPHMRDANHLIDVVKNMRIRAQLFTDPLRPDMPSACDNNQVTLNGKVIRYRSDHDVPNMNSVAVPSHPKLSSRVLVKEQANALVRLMASLRVQNLIQEQVPFDYCLQKESEAVQKGGAAKRKFKTDLENEGKNFWHARNSSDDNYMTNQSTLRGIFDAVKWYPAIDLCCELTGANSTAPFFYSVDTDSRRQATKICGHDLMCNPPYYDVAQFTALLEKAWFMNRKTRAILVVPSRPSQVWHQTLVKRVQATSLFDSGRQGTLEEVVPWRIVAVYLQGADLFTGGVGANKDRTKLKGTIEDIIVYELNSKSELDPTGVTHQDIEFRNQNIVPAVTRIRRKLISKAKQRKAAIHAKLFRQFSCHLQQCRPSGLPNVGTIKWFRGQRERFLRLKRVADARRASQMQRYKQNTGFNATLSNVLLTCKDPCVVKM